MNRPSGAEPSTGARCVIYLAIATPFVVWSLKTLLGASSVDLAHHYSLVYTLIEQWSLPAGYFDESLGEMSYYPRLGHGIAAVLGLVLGSPLLGLQLVARCAILALWTSLLYLLWSMPRRAAWLSLSTGSLLYYFNRTFLGWELHGTELADHFFFAQLVAQAAMVMAIAFTVHMERRQLGAPWRYGFLLLCLYVVTGIHLLPAVVLVAVILGVVALDLWPHRLHAQFRLLVAGGGAVTLLAVLIVLGHPAFKVMRQLSQSDGDLTLSSYRGHGPLALYSLVVLALSVGIVMRSRSLAGEGHATFGVNNNASSFAGLRMLALLGLAISAGCLAQSLALVFGFGSDYATKKYLYGLNTVALLELACLPVLWFPAPDWLHGEGTDGRSRGVRLLHSCLLLPALSVAAFQLVEPRVMTVDAARIVILEQHLRLLHASSPPPPSGQYVYVLPMPGLPPMVSYMFSISIFKTPRRHNVNDLMANRPLSQPDLVDAFVVEPGTFLGHMLNCRRAASNSRVVMIDAVCSRLQEKEGVALIAFDRPEGTEPCVISGFSGAEPTGRWTSAKEATVRCPVPLIGGRKATTLRLSATAFIAGPSTASNTQRLRILINGGLSQELFYDGAHPEQAIVVKLPADVGEILVLRLELPDAVSPRQIGLSDDGRALGLFVRTLEFTR